ncbi:transposase [Sulfoacidibacillus thermotolerans]|uniref:Transposase n=1 Tax=Sulfoacidibacillus thermotolerans TaxID=1765684 RepID=A0A2U3D892_SULT2|nr:transposase [Sulfoacidibacillus thermotolerans]PWI57497.1 transposase [Sulfoacidibacillus thermotolerans]
MAQQKQYDKEFKLNTVQLILESGKPITQIARELRISSKTLYGWVAQYKDDPKNAFIGSGNLKPDDKELRDMQKRIRDLEEENAILKKAMRIFTNDRK